MRGVERLYSLVGLRHTLDEDVITTASALSGQFSSQLRNTIGLEALDVEAVVLEAQ